MAYPIAPQRAHDVWSAGLLYRRAQPKLTKLLREIWMDTQHTLMLNANTEQAATQLLWLSTLWSSFLYSGSHIFQRGFCLCVPYLIRSPCINLIRFGQHDRKMAASRSLYDNFLLQTLHTLRKLMRPKISAGVDAVPELSVCILVRNGDSQLPSNARTIKPGPPTRTQLTQEQTHAQARAHARAHTRLIHKLPHSPNTESSQTLPHVQRVPSCATASVWYSPHATVDIEGKLEASRLVCQYPDYAQCVIKIQLRSKLSEGYFLSRLFWGEAYLKLAPRASGPRKVGGQPTLVFGTLIAFMCFCTVLSFLICECVKIAPSHHTVSDAGTITSRPDVYVSQDAARFAKTAFAETRGSQHTNTLARTGA